MLRLLFVAGLAGSLIAQSPVGFGDRAEFVERLCFDCHGGDATKGKLDLGVAAAGPVETLARLSRLRSRVAAAEMPPAHADQPDPEERAAFVAWLDERLRSGVPRLPTSPGRITIRRLNSSQWARTIFDLFGVRVSTSDFPADDLGYGFDTIGDALSFSTLHLEKYLAAAGAVAAEVLDGEDPENPTVRRFEAEAMQLVMGPGAGMDGDHANLYTRALIEQRVELPRDGIYRLRVLARGDQAGDEPPKMALRWDGRELEVFDVPKRRIAEFEVKAPFSGGAHHVGLAFLNDFYDPKNPDRSRRDRNLRIDRFELVGPLDPRVVPVQQQWVHAAVVQRGAAQERVVAFCRTLLPRVWRRPVTDAEVGRHAGVGEAALRSGDSLTVALRLVMQSALSSPHFLFRGEVGSTNEKPGQIVPVSSVALASRLSYFLWASTPDEQLLEAAGRQALGEREALVGEARRLLADPRADSLATEFAAQWLELKNLGDHAPDPDRFPGFDDAMRASLRSETERLFLAVLREDRDVRDLLDCDFTHVDERLAAFYGIPFPEGAEGFVRVALPERLRRRGGLLGHASVLAVTSNPTRTSPVKRGKWILENLLGAPPPPPPPGNDSLPDEGRAVDSAAALREQMAQHRESRKCAVCHVRMDALGLSLERFDAIGRYRDRDTTGEIDCSGELPDGRRLAGLADLKRVIRSDPAFVRAVAHKLFVYGIGREPRPVDLLKLDYEVGRLLEGGKVTLTDLILKIVDSDAFRLRAVEKEQ